MTYLAKVEGVVRLVTSCSQPRTTPFEYFGSIELGRLETVSPQDLVNKFIFGTQSSTYGARDLARAQLESQLVTFTRTLNCLSGQQLFVRSTMAIPDSLVAA